MRWLVVAIVFVVAAVILAVRSRGRRDAIDVGAVSARWIASHRADDTQQ